MLCAQARATAKIENLNIVKYPLIVMLLVHAELPASAQLCPTTKFEHEGAPRVAVVCWRWNRQGRVVSIEEFYTAVIIVLQFVQSSAESAAAA